MGREWGGREGGRKALGLLLGPGGSWTRGEGRPLWPLECLLQPSCVRHEQLQLVLLPPVHAHRSCCHRAQTRSS